MATRRQATKPSPKKGRRKPPPTKRPTKSRARPSPPSKRPRGWLFEHPTEVEARIEQIADMMLRQEWRAGRSHKALALEHGVSVSVIEGNASEARRHLRQLATIAGEDAKAQLIMATEDVLDMARKATRTELHGKKRVQMPSPDLTNANRALLTLAGLHGVMVQKHELEHHDKFAGWSREEKARFAATGELPKRGKGR